MPTPGISLPARPVDVCVVGGGIVGLATAWAIQQRRPELSIAVLEREPAWGTHQTGHNSGVIHSGLYYTPGSLKARLTRDGLARMYAFCAEHDLPVERCGKLVVATDASELERMAELQRRGEANGVEVHRLTAEQAGEIEPSVACVAALHVPETGITDFGLVAARLAELLAAAGATTLTGVEVRRIREDAEVAVVETSAGDVRAARVVTAAGLHSDDLARASGLEPEATIVPFRGEYFDLAPHLADRIRGLVYPVPDPSLPFLGVHLTRGVHGGVHVGPNAVPALARHGYRRRTVERAVVRTLLTDPAFRGLARRYWRTGSAEVLRSVAKPLFVRGVRRLLPGVRSRDLRPAPAGVRAQALAPDGSLVDDFVFAESGRAVHVLNAPSPAATASLAIGEHIADRVLRPGPGVSEPAPTIEP